MSAYSTEDDDDERDYFFAVLSPTSNGYLTIPDPADAVRTCGACGEDFGLGVRCECWRAAS